MAKAIAAALVRGKICTPADITMSAKSEATLQSIKTLGYNTGTNLEASSLKFQPRRQVVAFNSFNTAKKKYRRYHAVVCGTSTFLAACPLLQTTSHSSALNFRSYSVAKARRRFSFCGLRISGRAEGSRQPTFYHSEAKCGPEGN